MKQEKHGMRGTPTYGTWAHMKQRCLNPNDNNYKWYGGCGITICDSWKDSFVNFFNDMGERPEGLTIERINNNKGYYPENCKWATASEQRRNQRKRSKPKNNTSGVVGVCFCKRACKWRAFVDINCKKNSLGYFDNLTEAVWAREEAERKQATQ